MDCLNTESTLQRFKNARIKVLNGEAAYERDSAVFDQIQHPYALLAFLLRAAVMNHNRLRLVDFGGSLGTTYFQTRAFISSLEQIRWSVVEVPRLVECGRELVANDELSFHYTIDEAQASSGATTIPLSGVIGYGNRSGV
jgi:putative methyltransferase (TIGR04325 family)